MKVAASVSTTWQPALSDEQPPDVLSLPSATRSLTAHSRNVTPEQLGHVASGT